MSFMKNILNTCFAYVIILASNLAGAIESPTPLHYKPGTHILIPSEVQMPDQASISSPIGDYLLQSPIIKLSINGQGPYLFMFDTGASMSIISKKLADKLNLPIIKNELVQHVTPTQIVKIEQIIYLPETIEIGNILVKNYGIVASGDHHEDKRFENLRVDGLISANIFYGELLTIDYPQEKLHVQKGSLSTDDEHVLPCLKGFHIPVIEGTINFEKLKKEEKQAFIIDTGDASYIYINTCRISEMKDVKDQETFIKSDLYDKSSHMSLAQLYGDIIFSKSVILKSPYVSFSAANCEHPPYIGTLGRKFFETHEVTLDQKNGLAKIKPYTK